MLLLCCQTMSKVMKSISTLRSYSCEQCKAFSFFTKNVWMQPECRLRGKKRFQVMYTNGKARKKWHYHLDTFCWKLHLFKKQKNLCFLHFFWSVNNSLSLQQAFVYIFKKQKEIEIHKTCNGYLLDKNLPHCAKQFLSLKLIYLL